MSELKRKIIIATKLAVGTGILICSSVMAYKYYKKKNPPDAISILESKDLTIFEKRSKMRIMFYENYYKHQNKIYVNGKFNYDETVIFYISVLNGLDQLNFPLTIYNFNNMALPGIEFKKLVGPNLVKLLNENECHNGYKFSTGLNIDTQPFYPIGHCMGGGIYFIEKIDTVMWLSYLGKQMYWVRDVIIPDDALVYVEVDINVNPYKSNSDCFDFYDLKDSPSRELKFKTNKLILGERRKL
ncbi:MAG: hypothetical protein Edafosvirus4_2 [Edafosvirus sp.]|uniref:Uncharacterized protein n=1 Tax=Edafosvirus sp. TaxID=2487765 RepID=A0A3G4ZT02_9VIRU|nr:MAG: hypothetical protein Edafosvirus4_2 [Edafosvirus sp.]